MHASPLVSIPGSAIILLALLVILCMEFKILNRRGSPHHTGKLEATADAKHLRKMNGFGNFAAPYTSTSFDYDYKEVHSFKALLRKTKIKVDL